MSLAQYTENEMNLQYEEAGYLLEKPLPSSQDAEKVILGAILLDNDFISEVVGALDPDDFYTPFHRRVYTAMRVLFESSRTIDPILIGEELKKDGSTDGGTSAITNLTFGLPFFSTIAEYIGVVKDKSLLRQLVRTSNSIIQEALSNEHDSDTVIEHAEEKIYSLTNKKDVGKLKPVKDALVQSVVEARERQQSGVTVAGVSTGLYDIDMILQGMKPGQLIIGASRPSVGKTALSLAIGKAAAKVVPVAMFSLEMDSSEICERLICSDANVNSYAYRLGNLNSSQWDMVSMSAEMVGTYQGGIYLDDSPTTSLTSIRANLRRLSYLLNGQPIGLVMVDYIGLMSVLDPKAPRENQVSQLSYGLKRIAREFNVPVLALSQLNRNSEARSNTKFRPTMSDLRESGAVEQDADVVLLLYREDMYIPDKAFHTNIAEVIVAKNRSGPTGVVKLQFSPETGSFRNYTAE